jgi:DNA ligase (NAD+)
VFGLGIRGIGLKTARDLAQHFGTLEALTQADFSEVSQIAGIGPIVGAALVEYFRSDTARTLLRRLFSYEVHPKSETMIAKGELSGLTVVITGTLPTLSRRDAAEMVLLHGGQVSESVGKKTSFVLAGEAAGSKLDRAQALGIPVLTEEQFRARCGET